MPRSELIWKNESLLKATQELQGSLSVFLYEVQKAKREFESAGGNVLPFRRGLEEGCQAALNCLEGIIVSENKRDRL